MRTRCSRHLDDLTPSGNPGRAWAGLRVQARWAGIAARATPDRQGRGTTGLLLSDTVLLDETLRLRDGLGAWAYETDAASAAYESEAIDPSE